eukprot:7762108-Pyramimonas_sp.AAC.2
MQTAHQMHLILLLGESRSMYVLGVWSAETHNQCGMLDMMVIEVSLLEEVRLGPQTSMRMKEMREAGDAVEQ